MSEPQGHEARSEGPPVQQTFAEGEEAPPPGTRAMAVVRWLLVFAMAVAALSSVLYAYRESEHQHGQAEYYCPMHPAVVQDQPGECPICNMALVLREPAHPVDAGAWLPGDAGDASIVHGLGPIELSEQRVQLIGMRTAQVERRALPSELTAVGYVAPPESGLFVIQPRFSGWIEELAVAQSGQLVQRGELLARVYSPELLSAQQELLNARKWADAGQGGKAGAGLADSARTRLEILGMQPAEIAEVERSGTAHRAIEIRSPARGYVAQKEAVQGLYIQPGTRLFEIADLSSVWVMVELAERDAARVKVGQRARLALTAYPGESFSGKVQLVYPTLDPSTRSQRARVEFKNPTLRLRPGMFGDLTIEQAGGEGLVVPRSALIDSGEQQYVFVSEGAGRFVPRAVRLGARFQESVQVTEGLREGETVVTTGNFLIDSESRLRNALEGAR